MSIDQEELILKIADRFCLENVKITTVPIEKGLVSEVSEDSRCHTKLPYKELLSCLMFVMIGSRPDICYSISFFLVLSRVILQNNNSSICYVF